MNNFNTQTMHDFLPISSDPQYRGALDWQTLYYDKSHAGISYPQQPSDDREQVEGEGRRSGRKPSIMSPAVRKEQNRAAQRAFRERKEQRLQNLEGTIRQLREQRDHMAGELKQAKGRVDAYVAENWYLKGVVLTLQFVCLHHGIHIPAHSPYLSEDALCEMAKAQPSHIDAYVDTYTKNDVNLKATMAVHFANFTAHTGCLDNDYENNDDMSQSAHSQDTSDHEQHNGLPQHLHPSNPGALQQTKVQSIEKDPVEFQQTILQLAIPHDPRIDLVPESHMRDRMIIFRNIVDYDRCFSLLLGRNVYGQDLAASPKESEEFLDEFWYLVTDYSRHSRRNVLNELDQAVHDVHMPQGYSNNVLWTEDAFSPLTAGASILRPSDMILFDSSTNTVMNDTLKMNSKSRRALLVGNKGARDRYL